MKLYIKEAGNSSLYDLIQVNSKGHSCLLQDTLENCLSLFKKTISELETPKGISYSYDDSTHIVVNYTNGTPITTDGIIFSKS